MVKKKNQEMSKDLKSMKEKLKDETNSTGQLEKQLNATIKETSVAIVAAVGLKAI